MGVGGSRYHSEFFLENHPGEQIDTNLIFWGILIPYMCILCVNTLLKVVLVITIWIDEFPKKY